MPVNFDEYQNRSKNRRLAFDPDSNSYHILAFLYDHPEAGFKPSEIADQTDITAGSVRGTLHRLKKRGLVRHAEPYWAIGEDDRLASLTGTMLSLKAIGDRYGDDEFDGWDEAAVDPREMRDD